MYELLDTMNTSYIIIGIIYIISRIVSEWNSSDKNIK